VRCYVRVVLGVRVLYFGGLRDAVGVADEALTLPPSVRTVGDLCAVLAARHRAYAESIDFVRVARNEAFAADAEALSDGDVIALMPPMAGG
jgi:sulfur-carrier protein